MNILNLDIRDFIHIGKGFAIYHGAHGTVINPYTVIGDYVSVRHNTTIGSSDFYDDTKCPIIGNHVEIGPNSVILGNIKIGDYSQIGGGTVVVKDVLSNSIVAGNPAKVIKMLSNTNLGG